MAKYRVDGLPYEIDDSLNLEEAVAGIRASQTHKSALEPSYAKRVLTEGAPAVANLALDAARAVPLGLTALGEGIRADANEGGGIMNRAADAFSGMMDASRAQVGFKGPAVDRGTEALQHGIETAMTATGDFVERAADRPYIPLPAHLFTENRLEQDNPKTRMLTEMAMNFAPVPGAAAVSRMPRVGSTWKAAQAAKAQEMAALRAHVEQQAQQKAAAQAELDRIAEPYRTPNIEKVQTLKDRNLDATYEGIINPDYAKPQIRTSPRLEDPHTVESFPFNEKAHENAVPFELRQEVLQRPEVKEIIDSYRSALADMEARLASKEEIAQLQKGFGEYMEKFGIKDAADAHGLNRPLYDSSLTTQELLKRLKEKGLETNRQDFTTALPIEKVRGLDEQPTKPADWAKHEPTPFELAGAPDQWRIGGKFAESSTDIHTRPFGGKLPRNQQGYIDFSFLPDGLKKLDQWLSNSLFKMPMYHGTGSNFRRFDEGPHRSQFGHHFGTLEQARDRSWDYGSKQAKIKTMYLNVRNPIELPDLGAWEPKSIWNALGEKFAGDSKFEALGNVRNSQGRRLKDYVGGTISPRFSGKQAKSYQNNKIVAEFNRAIWQFLKDKGYDGVVYWNKSEGTPIVPGGAKNLQNLSVIVPDNKQIAIAPKPSRKWEPSERPALSLRDRATDPIDPQKDTYLKQFDAPRDPFKGPGKKQAGAIQWKPKSEYEKFKEDVKKHLGETPEPVMKAMFEAKKEGAKPAEFSPSYHAPTTEHMKNVPGLKEAIDKYTAPLKPLDEAKPEILAGGDLPGNVFAKLGIETLSGSQGVSKVFDNPHVNWSTAKIRRAIQEHDKLATEMLYNKERGLVHTYKELSKAEKAEWLKTAIAMEGKTGEVRFDNPKLQTFHENLRKGLDTLWEYGNKIREMQGFKGLPYRENYLPAKFLGEFYTVLKNKDGDIVGWYSGNSVKEIEGFIKQIKKDYPDYTPTKVLEKSTGYNPEGSAHAYGVYHQLQAVLEAGSPEAKALSAVIDKFKQEQAKRTAGFYLHAKSKKGILGSSGRNEYRSALKNADEMMQTIQLYTHQLFEYGEMAKINKDITRVLDANEFPGMENAQKYVEWYYQQARGMHSAFANALHDMINTMAHSVGMSGSSWRGAGAVTRSYLMWNMLSFHNTRFLMAQLLQPNQFIMQHIAKMKADGIPISPGDIMNSMVKGYAAEVGLGSKAMKADMNWAKENRVIDQSVLEDINSRLVTKDANAFNILIGNQSIRWTEQLARRQVFATYMNLLRDKMPLDHARQVAKEFTEFSMTDYRPVEMPKIYKDLGPLGSAISPLARFKHNAFTQLASFFADAIRGDFSPKHFAAFATAITVQWMYSGLMGLPGREDLDMFMAIFKKLGWVDNNLTEIILKSDNPNYVSHGLISGVTGADMATTLGMSKALPSEHSMAPLFSKGFSIIDAAIEAASKQTNNSFAGLAKELLPTSGVVQAPLEWAMREGTIVTDPKHRGRGDIRRPDDITSKEWLYRFGTLRSVEESKEKAGNYERQKNEDRIREKKAILMERAFEDWRAGKPIAKHYKPAAKLGMTQQDLVNNMQRMTKERVTTVQQREGGLPPRTPNQIRKYQEVQRYR